MAENYSRRFEQTNNDITDDIKHELEAQGHKLTGKLEGSIKAFITSSGNTIELSAEALDYIEELEKGVPADKIQMTEAEFQSLKLWVKRRGMATSDFEAGQIASAIYTKWKKEGKPTEGSKAYSSTGERLYAINSVFVSNNDRYSKEIDDQTAAILDTEFGKITGGEF